MREKVEDIIKSLISSFQIAKIYTVNHPLFEDSVEKTYLILKEILKNKDKLIIGIIGEELVVDKEIFFDLSKKSQLAIKQFKSKDIEKIVFHKDVTKEELIKFISILMRSDEDTKKDIQKYFPLIGIENIEVSKIKTTKSSPQEEVLKSINYLKEYETFVEKVTKPVEAILNDEKIDYLELKFTIADIMDTLMSEYKEFLKLSTMKRYDVVTFVHLFNVSILSMYFSIKCGFNKEDALDIGIAALFHDIGKIYISKKILKKPGGLTNKELSYIRSHTVLGAEILLKYVDKLGVLPVLVAFEHHLRYDQKGYPKLCYSQFPCIASLIVSICDVYDALIQRRTYKRDYPPEIVYNIMIKEKGTLFEPRLLDKFFKAIGVWPIGTIVLLNNNKVGIVREENEEDIFSPKVEIVSPEREGIVDLGENKGLRIARSLNPLSEGKKYLYLI
jgi:HD-GYP domain-containing protein (c-di-GMP phosphodiesterase class II)